MLSWHHPSATKHFGEQADEHTRSKARLNGKDAVVIACVRANGAAKERACFDGRTGRECAPIGSSIENSILEDLAGTPRRGPCGDELGQCQKRTTGETRQHTG
eukprot:scaffold260599_cov32-Tisochrysis_lutea.AAC.4